MQSFEITARAVIMQDSKILLCKRKDRDYYFLPGGHVEFGETAKNALVREINEELGIKVADMSFIGASENIFKQDNKQRHELNLIFQTELVSTPQGSAEAHLEFIFLEKPELSKANLLPQSLANAVRKWFASQKPFWASEP